MIGGIRFTKKIITKIDFTNDNPKVAPPVAASPMIGPPMTAQLPVQPHTEVQQPSRAPQLGYVNTGLTQYRKCKIYRGKNGLPRQFLQG